MKGVATIPFFFLKAGNKTPIWKMSSQYQVERNIPVIKNRKPKPKEFCTNGPC